MTIEELERWLSNFPPNLKIRSWVYYNEERKGDETYLVVDLPDGSDKSLNINTGEERK